jgi:electron transfer flavoprotein beta subunit
MKILICVKRVLDYNVKVRIRDDHSDVDLTNLKMSMNPFDEIAVEEGVRLKEQGIASELVVLSIDKPGMQETLRSALALGADRGILIETQDTLEPLSIAKLIAYVAGEEKPDVILMGKQAIDDDCNQTGQMVAGLLGWSQGTFLSSLNFQEGFALTTREVDGGLEILKCPLPVVLTTDLRLNTPRYPKLPNIMKAKQKPIDIKDVSTIGISLESTQKIIKVSPPPGRQGGIKVSSVDDLIHHLRHEAKVI